MGVVGIVLLAVLLVGVVAGRARRRWSFLLAGLVTVVVLGVAALLLVAFRYPAAGAATDELLREQGATISR